MVSPGPVDPLRHQAVLGSRLGSEPRPLLPGAPGLEKGSQGQVQELIPGGQLLMVEEEEEEARLLPRKGTAQCPRPRLPGDGQSHRLPGLGPALQVASM